MENYSVKWDDFHKNMHLYLKHEKDFFDVTLACDDNQQIEAHKIILSSGSLFFRDILSNVKHPQPFVYLSGIRKSELQSIVDFLYNGQTNVDEKDVDKFFEAAKLLKVLGIENNQNSELVKNYPDASISDLNDINHTEGKHEMSGNTFKDDGFENTTEQNIIETETEDSLSRENIVATEGKVSIKGDLHHNDVYEIATEQKFDIQNELIEKPDKMIKKFDGLWEYDVVVKHL